MSDTRVEEIREQVDHARDLLPIDTIEYDETQDYLAHLADDIDHLLTKLDEAQERERVLLVGVREAHRATEYYGPNHIVELDTTRAILSRLLSSTTNEEGKNDE